MKTEARATLAISQLCTVPSGGGSLLTDGLEREVWETASDMCLDDGTIGMHIHSEAAVLLRAGSLAQECDLYTNRVPCDECCKLIVHAQVRRVFIVTEAASSYSGAAVTKGGLLLRYARIAVDTIILC